MKVSISSQSNIFFKKTANYWILTELRNIKKNDIFKYSIYGKFFDFQKLDKWSALSDAESADQFGKSVGLWKIEAEKFIS